MLKKKIQPGIAVKSLDWLSCLKKKLKLAKN